MLGPDIVVGRFPAVAGLPLALDIGDVTMAKQGMEEIEHIRPRLFERLLAAVSHVDASTHDNVTRRDSVAMLGQALGVIAYHVLPGRQGCVGSWRDRHVF